MRKETIHIEPRFDTQERAWRAELIARNGYLLHTTALRPTKEEAVAVAKAWLKRRRESTANAGRQQR